MSSTNPDISLPPGVSSSDLWSALNDIRTGCYPYMPHILKPVYGYHPTLGAGITFDVLFALVMIGHFIMLAFYRRWTSLLFAVGSLTELIGWSARTWSALCPYNQSAFLMQITTLILAPTFYSAALYVLLASLIDALGRQTSVLSPKWYAVTFCACDVLSLVIQAIGGGMAAQATNDPISGDTAPGTHTMVAGIVFQLFTMTVFAGLVVDFLRRVWALQRAGGGGGASGGEEKRKGDGDGNEKTKGGETRRRGQNEGEQKGGRRKEGDQQGEQKEGGPKEGKNQEGGDPEGGRKLVDGGKKLLLTSRLKLVLASMFTAFIMIYVRSIYRTIELAEGWSGHLITHEGYFIALDAALMFVAAVVWLVLDPAFLLREGRHGLQIEAKKGGVMGEYRAETGEAQLDQGQNQGQDHGEESESSSWGGFEKKSAEGI